MLKGGQGTMRDLGNGVELSAQPSVSVSASGWRWDSDVATVSRFAKLDVDTKPTEGTVITLDGLSSLKDNNDDLFQTTPGKVREGLPMLRAEVRLIGKDNLEGADRTAQLKAFRDLILDTQRQNFFIYTHEGKEIHMRGYQPTSAYKESYAIRTVLSGGSKFLPAQDMLLSIKLSKKHTRSLANGQRIMVHSTKAGIWNPMLKKR